MRETGFGLLVVTLYGHGCWWCQGTVRVVGGDMVGETGLGLMVVRLGLSSHL